MADRHQLNVTLPDDMADQVREKVASGRYANESDVVIEALRTLEDREQCVEQWLRTDVAEAYDELEADPASGVSLDDVRESLAATVTGSKPPAGSDSPPRPDPAGESADRPLRIYSP